MDQNTTRKKMFKEYLYKRATQDKQIEQLIKFYEAATPVVAWLNSKDNASWADTETVNNFIQVYKDTDLSPIVSE